MERLRLVARDDRAFDPIAVGAALGLARAESERLWQRVCAELDDPAQREQRFRAWALRWAAGTGARHPDIGRLTRNDDDPTAEARPVDPRWSIDALWRAPGRHTLCEIEARIGANDERGDDAAPVARADSPLFPPRIAARIEGALPAASELARALSSLGRAQPPVTREAPRRARRFVGMGRAQRVREVARMQEHDELTAALRRGEAGLPDALAAALHDGAVRPHPVDVFRANARGLARSFRAMASADAAPAAAPAALERLSDGGGEPLPHALRVRLEALFGHGFAHVRVHTDAAAASAAAESHARALTIGSHIYFGAGHYAPGSEAGDRLLLHELTHVVQHDEGRLAPPASGRVELSSPTDATEREARAMESRAHEVQAPPAAAPPATAAPAAAPTGGKRASADFTDDAESWLADRVDDVASWTDDQIEALVAKVAPDLIALVKNGPGALIQDALEPAVKGWVASVTSGVDIGQFGAQLQGSFASAFEILQGAKANDPKCCETLVKGVDALRGVATAFLSNPVMAAVQRAFSKVADVAGTVAKLVAGPVFDALKAIAGPAWDAITGVASKVGGWLATVKSVASKAFDWVAQKLGFASATGEGGLTQWLQQKAAAVWDTMKATLAPAIGPLKTLLVVFHTFTGLTELYAIVKYGPQLVEAVQWLWQNRNNPEAVKQNPALLGGSILPKLLGVGQGFVARVKSGVTWLVQQSSALAAGALQLAGAVAGVPLLAMATSFAQSIADGVQSVETWAAGAFQTAETWLADVYETAAAFIRKYATVLTQVATAVLVPAMIPSILAGEAWQWLPDCIKPPLVDLLLDAVIAFVQASPAQLMFGPMWLSLRAGVVGFLQAVRGRSPDDKIKVSNKLAKIFGGASPMLIVGFVKGLLKGVWDGIAMPFEAIFMVANGMVKVADFFLALGTEADEKASPAAKGAAPTPAAAPKSRAPLPSAPSVITSEQAQAVVSGIVGKLMDGKPKSVPPPSGAARAAAPGNEYAQLASEAKRMNAQLAPPAATVSASFAPAVRQVFTGGKGMTLDDVIAKMHQVWEGAKAAVAAIGAKIANAIVDFLLTDSADEELGESVGYMVGMIAFQALLDYFSAGTWTGAMAVVSAIAKFLNWPMEFLGEAMKVLKTLGGYLLDGLKSLGGMLAETGALREVVGAFREIAVMLGEFADELGLRFGKTAERDAAGGAERDVAGGAERDAGGAAEKEALKAEELAEAIEVSRMVAVAEDAGHVPGPAIAVSLEALRARYTWIKTYEAVPNAEGYEIFLIASRFSIAQAHTELGKLPNQLGDRFSRLGDDVAVAFASLPEAQLEHLALLSDDELLRLAEVNEAGLANLGALALQDLNVVEKVAQLDVPAIQRLATLSGPEIEKLAALTPDAFAKYAAIDRKALAKFAQIDPAILEKLAALDAPLLEKYGSLRAVNMIEAYGALTTAQLERLGRFDKGVLEKFAGWTFDPPDRAGFNNLLVNITKQNDATLDLIATLKPNLTLAERAVAGLPSRYIEINGASYLIDADVIEHILQRHTPEFWEGSVKEVQSFLPRGWTPERLVSTIRKVLLANKEAVTAIGLGYATLPDTVMDGFTWQLGLNKGHVGQFFPKFPGA